MGNIGVKFAGEGAQDLLGNDSKMSAAPQEPSGRGDPGMKFVDNGGGDKVNIGFNTSTQMNIDDVKHDYKSGEGFTPIADNDWTGRWIHPV